MIPFTSSHLSMERGILYGINVHNNSLVVFDPFSRDLENANKVVFAKSGAGKSYACKVEALRALMLGSSTTSSTPKTSTARSARPSEDSTSACPAPHRTTSTPSTCRLSAETTARPPIHSPNG